MAVRKAYWGKSKEVIDWCTDEELKILGQQANKALNTRVDSFLRGFDAKEQVRQAKINKTIRDRSKKIGDSK